MATAAEILRENGFRVTRLRVKILDLLMHTDRSYSAPQLFNHFGQREDRVTIYRTLSDLEQKGIFNRFLDTSGTACYVFYPGYSALSPHFRCNRCGHMLVLPALPEEYMQHIQMHEVEKTSLLFSGICRECLRATGVHS